MLSLMQTKILEEILAGLPSLTGGGGVPGGVREGVAVLVG